MTQALIFTHNTSYKSHPQLSTHPYQTRPDIHFFHRKEESGFISHLFKLSPTFHQQDHPSQVSHPIPYPNPSLLPNVTHILIYKMMGGYCAMFHPPTCGQPARQTDTHVKLSGGLVKTDRHAHVKLSCNIRL